MALLSEKEKEQLNRVLAEYPNSEDLDLTAFIAEVIGITGVHTEEGWYNQNINDTHITFYFMSDEDIDFSEDTNENEEYYIQVDIWSKEDCFRLKKKVKKLLKKAGFTYFTGNDQYEVETGIPFWRPWKLSPEGLPSRRLPLCQRRRRKSPSTCFCPRPPRIIGR